MRLGTCLLIGGHTPQGALHKLADFCSAPVAGFYSAVDNERHDMGRHITYRQIEDLIVSKLVTPEQVRAAGLQV